MIKHIGILLFKSISTLILSIPIILLSPLITAIALPFRVEHPETDKPFTQYPGTHRMVNLPKWAKWWDNVYDGMWGDKRGWWNNYIGDCTKFKSMWLWNGIRNNANYYKRNVVGVDVSKCIITKLAGQDVIEADAGYPGWQFLVADCSGKLYHRFFLEIPWSFNKERLLLIDIGWKIKLSHNNTPSDAEPQDKYKGSVFTISPWKSL